MLPNKMNVFHNGTGFVGVFNVLLHVLFKRGITYLWRFYRAFHRAWYSIFVENLAETSSFVNPWLESRLSDSYSISFHFYIYFFFILIPVPYICVHYITKCYKYTYFDICHLHQIHIYKNKARHLP